MLAYFHFSEDFFCAWIVLWSMSCVLRPTLPPGRSVEQCDTPSPPAPPSGHRRGSLQVPASVLSLHFLTVTAGIPPGPRAPPLHTTEAAE